MAVHLSRVATTSEGLALLEPARWETAAGGELLDSFREYTSEPSSHHQEHTVPSCRRGGGVSDVDCSGVVLLTPEADSSSAGQCGRKHSWVTNLGGRGELSTVPSPPPTTHSVWPRQKLWM